VTIKSVARKEGGARSSELMAIVGVVKDSKSLNLRDDSPPVYYRPYRQMGQAHRAACPSDVG